MRYRISTTVNDIKVWNNCNPKKNRSHIRAIWCQTLVAIACLGSISVAGLFRGALLLLLEQFGGWTSDGRRAMPWRRSFSVSSARLCGVPGWDHWGWDCWLTQSNDVWAAQSVVWSVDVDRGGLPSVTFRWVDRTVVSAKTFSRAPSPKQTNLANTPNVI